jgi:hypothetical protein
VPRTPQNVLFSFFGDLVTQPVLPHSLYLNQCKTALTAATKIYKYTLRHGIKKVFLSIMSTNWQVLLMFFDIIDNKSLTNTALFN